jgi:two-component system OmpR family sensor kinase
MRAQLTLWYTVVVARVLVIFALATYAYLARASRERTDQSLADTAHSLISNFDAELAEDEGLSSNEAAAEVTGYFQFKDRQAIVFDERGATVAASVPPTVERGKSPWPELAVLSQSLKGLIEAAAQSGHAYATLHGQPESIRAFAVTASAHEGRYAVVIASSLHDQDEALAQARRAFYVAVPLALVVASLGGYFLAHKSLAPVVAMGDRAARIGASNLNARLATPHPRNELGRLAQIFNELLARLDVSFEQQRRFMADASHELRTPVAIVRGESEVALSQGALKPEDYRESLAIIHDEGRRLTRIIEDLFMLARADAGQYQPDLTTIYLDETVGECVRAVRSLAAQHGVELDFRHDEDELVFRGDEGLIRRMVLNLLDNAIKHTPDGGQVRVRLAHEDSSYAISITDTGPGIPPEAQPHIFERFYRVDQARSYNGESGGSGAGLGLSIASWIAETHGGRIILDRADQSGSAFVIFLPVAEA